MRSDNVQKFGGIGEHLPYSARQSPSGYELGSSTLSKGGSLMNLKESGSRYWPVVRGTSGDGESSDSDS